MSYTRWSTIINSPFTNDEELNMVVEGIRLDKRIKTAQERNPESYLSDWYIFWHSMGDDEDNSPENQYLAMWLAGEELNPVADYATVKRMYESDDWNELGFEVRQKELLRDCVKRWLDNVERTNNEN